MFALVMPFGMSLLRFAIRGWLHSWRTWVVQDARHALELLLQGLQHRLRYLKLDGSWMLLDCQSVLRQVLDQELVLEIVCLLSHLDDHVLLVGRSFGHAWARWAEGRCLLLMHVHRTRLWVHRRVRRGR